MSYHSFQPGDVPAALRDRARRFREHANGFGDDVVRDQLREVADELDAQADAMEAKRGSSGPTH